MKYVLTIDGGGIRGIIPALFCREVEQKSGKRISELFDLIAGTSTGGLIALGLAKPSESSYKVAESLLSLYEQRGAEIFSNPKWFWFNVISGPKYKAEALERVLVGYFGQAKLSEAVKPVMVTCYDIQQRQPRILKSWEAQDNPHNDYLMSEAARATSAAPTYFAPTRVKEYALVDGGLFANNPTLVAYIEAKKLWPDEEIVLVSVGTGTFEEPFLYEKAVKWGLGWWAQPLLNCVFDGVSDVTDDILRKLLPQDCYYRFQCKLEQGRDALDDASQINIEHLKISARKLIDEHQNDMRRMIDLLKQPRLPEPVFKPGTLALLSRDTRDSKKSDLIRRTVKSSEDIEAKRYPWHFHEVTELKTLNDNIISDWHAIFLAIPYRQYFDQHLIKRLVSWVREGGYLVVTGFELGERHHETNLNELLYHFGLSFNSDAIVGQDFTGGEFGKDYGKVLTYNEFEDPNHPILQGVQHIYARSACSLNLEAGATPLVLVKPNKIRELQPVVALYSKGNQGYKLVSGEHKFKEAYEDPYRAVVAAAPKDLTGKGSVLAIGTWDFSTDAPKYNNDTFINNIWRWMINSNEN